MNINPDCASEAWWITLIAGFALGSYCGLLVGAYIPRLGRWAWNELVWLCELIGLRR